MEKTEAPASEELRKGLVSGEFRNWMPDDFDTLIKALASDHARPDETEAQSYTRMITEGSFFIRDTAPHPLAACSRLRRSAARPARIELQSKRTWTAKNHARLHSLAVDMQRARPGLSYERAFSTVYSDPKNKRSRTAPRLSICPGR